ARQAGSLAPRLGSTVSGCVRSAAGGARRSCAGVRERTGAVIKKFSVLYVGHIALENVGRDGTPADVRCYPNERLVEGMAMAEAVAKAMDEFGYDTLWMAEHHFQREGYEVFPNLILLGTYLACQT